mmetsp:Transcript_10435/g.25226  ORF Transcript_10435/g.25226 Transcript_10435/m.25226 type:complete len:537 (-) Transcript_10435:1504-3114(-)
MKTSKPGVSIRTAVVGLAVMVMISLHFGFDLAIFIPIEPVESVAYGRNMNDRKNTCIATKIRQILNHYSSLKTIRKWGCHRTEAPLIFVHIGKSGGGTIRARFAASARRYSRMTTEWRHPDRDKHVYPILSKFPNGTYGIMKGKFCNSKNRHFRMSSMKSFHQEGYEGLYDCQATTPIGRSVGCPSFWFKDDNCDGCKDMNAPECNTVYVGHNFLGNELHWLPAPILQKWWMQHWSPVFDNSEFDKGMKSIAVGGRDPIWCPLRNRTRTIRRRDVLGGPRVKTLHGVCTRVLSSRMDTLFHSSWEEYNFTHTNYAPFYASLPVHRTVLLREPFAWLLSRFFWNKNFRSDFKCDDMVNATYLDPKSIALADNGWIYRMALEHLFYLCGEECMNRYEKGEMKLHTIEEQAEANLRHSFSVVGLLNETKSFYDMVTARIQYVNMSLNPHVWGDRHTSAIWDIKEHGRCSKLYTKNETFRQAVRDASPHFSAVERLYYIGVEVNRFQQEELEQCRSDPIEENSRSVWDEILPDDALRLPC